MGFSFLISNNMKIKLYSSWEYLLQMTEKPAKVDRPITHAGFQDLVSAKYTKWLNLNWNCVQLYSSVAANKLLCERHFGEWQPHDTCSNNGIQSHYFCFVRYKHFDVWNGRTEMKTNRQLSNEFAEVVLLNHLCAHCKMQKRYDCKEAKAVGYVKFRRWIGLRK